jgi:CRP-like cAMP-binding protein
MGMWTIDNILIAMIKRLDLFSWITDEEALELANDFELKYIPKWTMVMREWLKYNKIYILKNWSLEARKSNWFSSIVLWNVEPWQIFWEMSYLKWIDSMATIISTTESDIWELETIKFDKFLKKYPKIMWIVYDTMKKRELSNEEILKRKTPSTNDDMINIVL